MKNNEVILWDPIYKEISIRDEIINIISSAAFQRLRRIKQTGTVDMVYPGATHSRFLHCCGVYHISKLLFLKNKEMCSINEYDKNLLSIACLLHDIGHGPLSHFFERITGVRHEIYTKKIILEDKELNTILLNINKNLPKDLCKVYDKVYKNSIVNLFMSSSLDLDRIDYLLRDSYYCGVNIGRVDYEWIIKNVKSNSNLMYYNEKAIPSAEQFLINRYYMYKQVYLHKNVKSIDGMILLVFKRIKLLYSKKENADLLKLLDNEKIFLKLVVKQELSVPEYLQLDDYSFWSFLKKLLEINDKPLQLIVNCIFKNKPFKRKLIRDISKKELEDIKKLSTYEDFNLYFFEKDILNPFSSRIFKNNPLYVIDNKSQKINNIENYSPIIKAIIKGFEKYHPSNNEYIYYYKIKENND